MNRFIISEAVIINEGEQFTGSVAVSNGLIEAVFKGSVPDQHPLNTYPKVNANGSLLIPGVIDDQVHFREPGLTHKADIYTESRAAVAGGITSFMEMPNTIPNTLTQELLEEKYELASKKSLANYSFYMGASNDNFSELIKTNPRTVCGIKVFMGSSTGNMLVDDISILEKIFAEAPALIAVHCEDEQRIRSRNKMFMQQYGTDAPSRIHPLIRDAEACYMSSSKAVSLARKHNTRLHVLHLSTAKELELFDPHTPLNQKKITTEVCLHHLWFTESDYDRLGNFMKWNPAVKSEEDREALWQGLLNNRIDVIATDHAPHTYEEKSKSYFDCPSGGPMVQHLLPAMISLAQQRNIPITRIVEKMCHNPATLFRIDRRGFIRKGYFADLVLIDLRQSFIVNKEQLLYKCGWSPLEGSELAATVTHTFVNGNLVFEKGNFFEHQKGQRLMFTV
ncbi:MAG: dihydroorotase [Bacteroidales bacterium]|jgi:dihydroorotase|nr:dihydroorotase [Bacteroidales bacterium]MCK9448194.1 dihydroorotase [Bacteroidales bacterium]MDD3700926.1 dihydroorotase [Bacteroidales bacterium]MDY0370000.1 dihydroorotase [Bacteroidales bacterium]